MTDMDIMSDEEAAAYDRRERARWARERGEVFSALADRIEHDRPRRENDVRRAIQVAEQINEHVEYVFDKLLSGTRYWRLAKWWLQINRQREHVIEVEYTDYDRDRSSLEFPLAYLWMTDAAVTEAERIRIEEVQRVATARKAAEAEAKRRSDENAERNQLARLKAKYEKENT